MAEIMPLHQQAFLSNKLVPRIDRWNTCYNVSVTIMQMWQSCYLCFNCYMSPGPILIKAFAHIYLEALSYVTMQIRFFWHSLQLPTWFDKTIIS